MNTIQRFVGDTEGLAFHEPVVIVYERELRALEQQAKGLEGALTIIAEDAVTLDIRQVAKGALAVLPESERNANPEELSEQLDDMTLELVLIGTIDGQTAAFLRQCAERIRKEEAPAKEDNGNDN